VTARRDVLRPVDGPARALARRLVRGAPYAALAVLEPATGHPLASRVAVATDVDGAPTILISGLSAHTGALDADGRCSLLFGEPGRGDPLAHPRVTVIGSARKIEPDDAARPRIRRRYLARHPKSALYVDFADFGFYRIAIERANFNGGFGRAYSMTATDLLSAPIDVAAFGELDDSAVAHMNSDHAEAVAAIAVEFGGAPGSAWQVASIDPDGMELVSGDELRRIDFAQPVADAQQLRETLVAMARAARQGG
jgi:heme iron utilization protein